MDFQFRLASPAAVRSQIARAILAESAPALRLGSVELQAHQRSAVSRLMEAIDEFHGALLCDEVGMGKTYVSLAVAARFKRCAIVAPAALVSMWRDSLAATAVDAELFTFESLSRSHTERSAGNSINGNHFELVVIDEAHHARNPATNRYFALATLVRGARVLLLTATPIHNRRKDLVALLSLFLGARAQRMTAAELSLCIVRREQQQLEGTSGIPSIVGPISHSVSDGPSFVERVMNLPPPFPVREGGIGGVLIGRSLVHQWASSEAAFRESLKRRIAKAMALCASLECGRYPSAGDLETWLYGDGALQLGFAELLAPPVVSHGEFLPVARSHLRALKEISSELGPSRLDDQRASIVGRIVHGYPGATVVAFAQYSETVSMLFRRLSHSARAALLTSHGARVAGGVLGRDEAIHRFAPVAHRQPPPPPSERIELLLTTDLLSEGVNLQDASVVIHLDVPWTVARMEQRVGRVARIGSLHAQVHVHLLRPPASAEAVLDGERILARKWNVARLAVGTSASSPVPGDHETPPSGDESLPRRTEILRSVLAGWIITENDAAGDCLLAAAHSSKPGFIAAVELAGKRRLLVCQDGVTSDDLDAQLKACRDVTDVETPNAAASVEPALSVITEWCARQTASDVAGIGSSRSVVRKQITARIDLAIQTALPHQRAQRSLLAARARRVATTQHGAAIEAELRSLARSSLPPDEWLEAVANLTSVNARTAGTDLTSDRYRLLALLLLVPTAHSAD